MKIELTTSEVLTILLALAFAGKYAQKERGKEFYDLYDQIDEQLKKGERNDAASGSLSL